jgi:ABC-type spermidine/putrescine transport system permease subunit I
VNNPLRTRRAEWFVTAPSFLWLAVFFAIPAVIVLAFTFVSSAVDCFAGPLIAASLLEKQKAAT